MSVLLRNEIKIQELSFMCNHARTRAIHITTNKEIASIQIPNLEINHESRSHLPNLTIKHIEIPRSKKEVRKWAIGWLSRHATRTLAQCAHEPRYKLVIKEWQIQRNHLNLSRIQLEKFYSRTSQRKFQNKIQSRDTATYRKKGPKSNRMWRI